MAKNKIKETIKEYWKAIIETLIIGILLIAFSQASKLFFFFAILYSVTDLIIIIYSAFQGNPKFIIVELLAYLLKR